VQVQYGALHVYCSSTAYDTGLAGVVLYWGCMVPVLYPVLYLYPIASTLVNYFI
jgi:hypothetical protein